MSIAKCPACGATELGVGHQMCLRCGTRFGYVPTKETNPKDAVAGDKVQLWLLSPIAKAAWSVAQYAGALKYGLWNWRNSGARMSVYLSAMQRHIDGLASGEEFDPVDGTRHEGNIMACAAIMLEARAAGKLVDDRPPRLDHRAAYAEAEAAIAKLRELYKDRTPRHWTIADSEPVPFPVKKEG